MANSDYKRSTAAAADFTPLSELAEDIDYLQHDIPLGRTNFPTRDSLQVGMAALCEDEFMEVTAITSTGVTVKRGTADTVPARHQEGSLIWFLDGSVMGNDNVEHSAGETNSVKYSPYTIGGGEMPIEGSEIDSVTYNWRFFRPYPPGQMRARGLRWYVPQLLTAEDPNMLLTWAHRDRVQEADQLIDHDIGNIGPEKGTTYTARIYDANGALKRTVTNIMATTHNKYGNLIAPSWLYTWQQAMIDLGFENPAEEAQLVSGHIRFCSTRQTFDSWQDYRIDFQINTQGKFIKVAQLAEMAAQVASNNGADPDTPPQDGMFGGQLAQQLAQYPMATDPGMEAVGGDGMFVAQLAQPAGQETNFYTPLNRNLFEAPYAFLAHRGDEPEANMLITVVARPSDRLTDAHDINTRYDYPAGSGEIVPYEMVAEPQFTPWATLGADISYLDTEVTFDRTSFIDGITLAGVQPGMVAQVDAEMIRIEDIREDGMTIARGCYDTVPARHKSNARCWFYEVAHGDDPTNYPDRVVNKVVGAAVQVKMRPAVDGPPLDLKDVPTDRLDMKQRTKRPYPPGQVRVDDQPWYKGKVMQVDTPVNITWVHRNRTSQGGEIIDHLAADQGAETDQMYRLSIRVYTRDADNRPVEHKIREEIVIGEGFTYTWDMARTDGYRAGRLLDVCGQVTIGLVLEAIRYDLVSWQNYAIPLAIPSYKCPPGQPPGGGQLPPNTGGGNGDTGGGTPGGQTPGGYNPGDGPPDPNDNSGGGDDGNGPTDPPEVPPEWPDPVDPPVIDPGDPNPNLAAHWDTNWDRHWDAYRRFNPGDTNA